MTFADWLRAEGYAPRTVTLYARTIRRAEAHLTELGITLDEADAEALKGFWLSLPPSRESRKLARCALLAWYRYRGRAGGGPARELPNLPAPRRLPRPHTTEEFVRLLEAARRLGGRHQVVAELLGYTGARISEVRDATWDQLELGVDNPVWYIAGKGSGRRGPTIRQVPLHPRLAATLRAWRASTSGQGPVLPSARSRDGRLNYATLSSLLRDVAAEAGVESTTPHRWRHTVATLGLEMTRDLRGLQDLLGHVSLSSTQIYTRVVPSRLRSLVEALPA